MGVFEIIIILAGSAIVGTLLYGSVLFAREDRGHKTAKTIKKAPSGVPAE